MNERRCRLDETAVGVDPGCLDGGDLVLAQTFANQIKPSGK
jgi:hypothetical protein